MAWRISWSSAVRREGGDVAGVGHQVPGHGLAEVEHVVDPLALFPLNGAPGLAQVHHHADLLLGDGLLLRLGAQAHEPEQAVGGHGQQPHRRPQDGGDAPHHAAGDLRHLHGLLHGDALGHQLAEHQGEVGQDDGHRHQGHRVEHRGGEADAQAQQPVGEHLREGVSGEGGAQEARQGDGNLNGGEEAGGLLHHLQELGGGAVALLRHHAELAGVEGDDGDLRHGEEGVDQDQNDL